MKQTHILVVEDSKLTYDRLAEKLIKEKFTVAPYTPSVEKALEHIEQQRPDVALLDINLDGEQTGIDLGKILSEKYGIPFIYVTELGDTYTFINALDTKHEQYIRKRTQDGEFIVSPDDFGDILRAIYTVLQRQNQSKEDLRHVSTLGIEVLTDFLENLKESGADSITKLTVKFEDIMYFTVDSSIFTPKALSKNQKNYVFLKTTGDKVYVKKGSLAALYPKLPLFFAKPNQKYIVNINHMEGWINQLKLKIDGKVIKITDTYRKEFMERYNRIFKS